MPGDVPQLCHCIGTLAAARAHLAANFSTNIHGPSRVLYCGLFFCDRLPICAEQLYAADSSSLAQNMERRPVSSLATPLVPHPIAAAASRSRPDFPSACAPARAGGFPVRAAGTCAPRRRTKIPP